MIKRDQIQRVLDNNQLRSVCREESSGDCWTIFCGDGAITIELNIAGDYVLIRSGPIECFSDRPNEIRLSEFMLANERVRIGRFAGVNEIYFELPFSLPNTASLTDEQLLHAITTAVGAQSVSSRDLKL